MIARWPHPDYRPPRIQAMKRPHKYGAVPTEILHKGKVVKCASKAEAKRFGELILLERAGAITGLQFHPRYPLQAMTANEALRYPSVYIADARYYDVQDKCTVVEDIKGVETAVFKLKAKFFRANYPGLQLRTVKARASAGGRR